MHTVLLQARARAASRVGLVGHRGHRAAVGGGLASLLLGEVLDSSAQLGGLLILLGLSLPPLRRPGINRGGQATLRDDVEYEHEM